MGKKCAAMAGLVKEGDEMAAETEGTAVRDAGLIAAAQKVEHYEIASYGSARTHAQLLGNEEAVRLLDETLEEEKETDQKLTELAESAVNQEAAAMDSEEQQAPARKSVSHAKTKSAGGASRRG